jgi:hypothetical protein
MNSSQNTAQSKQKIIAITEKERFEDGSVELDYALNIGAMEECAAENEKDVKDLTSDEIHEFVQRNLGLAVKCHDGWEVIKE